MEATAARYQASDAQTPSRTGTRRPRRISWEAFEKKYLIREDAYKYEWVDGMVEKTKRAMDFKQFIIYANLNACLESIREKGKNPDGIFIQEGDIFFAANHRRPDIAWFTNEQIARTAHGENQVPRFVIEVISNKDQMNLVHKKMQDYRAANVETVWHVVPHIEEVHVYGGVQLKRMTVCKGDDICSADSVIEGFEISALAVFHKASPPSSPANAE